MNITIHSVNNRTAAAGERAAKFGVSRQNDLTRDFDEFSVPRKKYCLA